MEYSENSNKEEEKVDDKDKKAKVEVEEDQLPGGSWSMYVKKGSIKCDHRNGILIARL
jgi:hypothetical protein